MAKTRGTQFDVTPEAIKARRHTLNLNRKVSDIMTELVDNNITFYTDVHGKYNENYVRTVAVLFKHLDLTM